MSRAAPLSEPWQSHFPVRGLVNIRALRLTRALRLIRTLRFTVNIAVHERSSLRMNRLLSVLGCVIELASDYRVMRLSLFPFSPSLFVCVLGFSNLYDCCLHGTPQQTRRLTHDLHFL